MNRLSVSARTLLLALAAIFGIVGMLLCEGVGDVPCFVLAATPLALGVGYAWHMHAAGERRARRSGKSVRGQHPRQSSSG
jgi:hypothetical protein